MKHVVAGLALVGALSSFSGALAQERGQQPTTTTREAKIAELVRKLGDPDFETREAAQRDLVALGAPALPALEQAKKSPDPEVASRATEAIARIRGGRAEAPPPGPETRGPDPMRNPEMPPLPDMSEVFKEFEEQLPREFGDMLRELFRGRLPGQDEQEDPVEERRPGQPRVRVWQWSNEGRPGPASPFDRALGAQVGPAGAALRAQLGLPDDEGLVINQLDPQGRAARAGIRLHDVIVGVDGRSVRSPRDLQPLLKGAAKVELYRRAQLQTVDVPAPEAAPAPAPAPTPAPRNKDERSF